MTRRASTLLGVLLSTPLALRADWGDVGAALLIVDLLVAGVACSAGVWCAAYGEQRDWGKRLMRAAVAVLIALLPVVVMDSQLFIFMIGMVVLAPVVIVWSLLWYWIARERVYPRFRGSPPLLVGVAGAIAMMVSEVALLCALDLFPRAS